MPKGKITARSVNNLLPDPSKPLFLWDTDLKGFGLKVTPKGKKIYIIQYRLESTQLSPTRFTIGKHGTFSPDEARQAAKEQLAKASLGEDPAEEKRKRKKDISIASLLDLYLEKGCAHKKQSSITRDISAIERHIKPTIGSKRLNRLTRGDIEDMMGDIAAGKTAKTEKTGFRGLARVRGGAGTANRALSTLSAALTYAVRHEMRLNNPAQGVKAYKVITRQARFLSKDELVCLAAAFRQAEDNGEYPYAIAALRILLMSGRRRNEVMLLRWEYVDLENNCFRVPDSKTGAATLYVGQAVIELLKALPRIEGNPWVIPSAKAEGPFKGIQKVWERVRKVANLEDVRIHDLRHNFASFAVAEGFDIYLLSKVLNHKDIRMTTKYAHFSDNPVKVLSNSVSRSIQKSIS